MRRRGRTARKRTGAGLMWRLPRTLFTRGGPKRVPHRRAGCNVAIKAFGSITATGAFGRTAVPVLGTVTTVAVIFAVVLSIVPVTSISAATIPTLVAAVIVLQIWIR